MARVLVVEDESKLARILEGYLRDAGYTAIRAADGRRALELFDELRPDLVLLDIMLPELDGLEVLKAIRRHSTTPVLMLTARVEEIDTVVGLELGADDYIAKPFRPREVIARVRAALRRASAPKQSRAALLKVGALELEPHKMQLTVGKEPVELTPLEFNLLLTLAQQPGRIFRRSELLEAANPESDALERTVDSHITRIRRKLEAHQLSDIIESVRGVGYRLKEPV
jgi:two-component system, OmpR family, response regulator AdeR